MEIEQTTSTNNVDNSSAQEYSIEDIQNVLDEPTNEGSDKVAAKTDEKNDTQSETDTSSQDNSQKSSKEDKNDCPEKFRNEDGTANVEKILKSYKELEPLMSQKAQWEKERAELLPYKEQFEKQQQQYEENARQQGFNSIEDMEHNYELANLTANEYAKYLRYTEEPEKVRQMLIDYANNPNDELLNDIEFEFPSEAIKRVTVAQERQKQYYQSIASKQAETQKLSNIENVIKYAVEKHNDIFDYEPFKQLFINTLNRYGDSFTNDDAEMLIGTMVQMKDLFQKEFEKQSNKDLQNKQATDAAASINTANSAPATSQKDPDISKMSDKQLVKLLKDYV